MLSINVFILFSKLLWGNEYTLHTLVSHGGYWEVMGVLEHLQLCIDGDRVLTSINLFKTIQIVAM
jgi:hypothetical protein